MLILIGLTAQAGIICPLYVGNTEKALDQTKRPFLGSYNYTNNSALVEVRLALDGIIRPPNINGDAHPLNPLATSNSISKMGMNAIGTNPGLFCIVYPYRLPIGSKVFFRVYNNPIASNATFYADTPIGTVIYDEQSTLTLNFNKAKAINESDSDQDGLNDSWESYLGIDDRLTNDYDGDGVSDLMEMLAWTAPDDPDSVFRIKYISKLINQVDIGWFSVPGQIYQIQRSGDLIQRFSNVSEVIEADDYEENKLISDTNEINHYRVIIPLNN